MTYDLITISLPLIAAYLGSYFLYQKNYIKRSTHIRLWNILILLTFLISVGPGLTLLCLVEYGIALPISQSLLYWHVQFGIALFWITIFHMHSYWKSSPSETGQKTKKQDAVNNEKNRRDDE